MTFRSTLLVVEDEEEMRILLEEELREAAYDVLTAAGGDEALERLGRTPVDAVVTDLVMPGMKGNELLKEVRALERDIPVVIITVEETLRAVPTEYREASLALGATRLQTVFRVVLPQAWSGVMTGAILAISRGAGEVAPVLFTGAAYFLPRYPSHPADQFMHLGYHIWVLTTQSTNVETTKPLLYSTVFVLLVLTFLLNITAILIRNRMRKWATR